MRVSELRRSLDRATRAHPPTRRVRFALAERSLERFASGRSLRLLDAGSSEGLFSETMARNHPEWTVEAIDVDPAAIAIAEASFADAGLDNVSARVADATTDLEVDTYDAVAALEFLTLVEDDRAALASLGRALKPGGLLVGHVPHKDWRPIVSSRTEWPGARRHGYDATGLNALIEGAGLEPQAVVATIGTLGLFAREVGQSHAMVRGGLAARLVWFPFAVVTAWLERHRLTWGPRNAYYFEARKPD